MTRREFLDNVTTFDELHSFCVDVDYDLQEDGAYSSEEYDNYIEDDIFDMVRDERWRDIRDFLSNLPDGYDFYFRDDWGEWSGRSYHEIDDFKDNVYEYAMDNDLFDPEDNEDEDEELVEEYLELDDITENDDSDEIEECDVDAFIWAGSAALKEFRAQSEKEEAYADQALRGMLFS